MFNKKLLKTAVLAISALLLLLSQDAQSQTISKGVKNIVLVHGAFADGSSWARIIPILRAKGYHVVAVQNPLTSLEEDVTATKRAIASMDGPVLLVGHSYGGMVITQAGNDPKVAGLLYVCALVPDEGQAVGDVVKAYPPAPGSAEFKQDAGFFLLSAKGIHTDFAQDLPFETRNTLYSTQVPWAIKATMTKVTHPAWKTKRSGFIIGIEDRMVPVALARAEVKMIGASKLELHSSHVPMISRPGQVAEYMVEVARNLK